MASIDGGGVGRIGFAGRALARCASVAITPPPSESQPTLEARRGSPTSFSGWVADPAAQRFERGDGDLRPDPGRLAHGEEDWCVAGRLSGFRHWRRASGRADSAAPAGDLLLEQLRLPPAGASACVGGLSASGALVAARDQLDAGRRHEGRGRLRRARSWRVAAWISGLRSVSFISPRFWIDRWPCDLRRHLLQPARSR